ncbi:MAG: hypothetical protein IJO94_02635, partial [Firmicutes bacterium]|nr:hypothetical protein [Bacillota bacterium]
YFYKNGQAVKKGLDAAKLAKQRRNAIHIGMRFVGDWGFCRVSAFINSLTEGLSLRFSCIIFHFII